MAKTYGYTHSAIIVAPIDQVWAWLSDPRRHTELHPLIRELTITDEGDGPGEGEQYCNFVVRDEVKLFGVDVPVVYHSEMIRRPAEHKLVIRATCPPRLVTTVLWSLRVVEGGTEVEEQVELTAPRLIAGFSTRQSRRSHEQMFVTLQRLVSEPERASKRSGVGDGGDRRAPTTHDAKRETNPGGVGDGGPTT